MQYRIEAKTRKWYKAVFFSLMKFAVVNSWIHFKMLKKTPDLKQYNFIKELCKQIQKKHGIQEAPGTSPQGKLRYFPSKFDWVGLFQICRHLPRKTNISKNCVLCKKKGKISKTPYKCIKCNDFVHPECFASYHLNK